MGWIPGGASPGMMAWVLLALCLVLAGACAAMGLLLSRQKRRHQSEKASVVEDTLKQLQAQKKKADKAAKGKGPSREQKLRNALECLLFVSVEPLSAARAAEVLGVDETKAAAILFSLSEDVRLRNGGLVLEEVAGGYRYVTKTDHAEKVSDFLKVEVKRRVSRSALEVLAIIAYHQPVSRPQVEAIRGVSSEGAMASLLERGLVRVMGRSSGVGRPVLFGTTGDFLKIFGLKDLKDLPPLPRDDSQGVTPMTPDLFEEIERRLARIQKKKGKTPDSSDAMEKVEEPKAEGL